MPLVAGGGFFDLKKNDMAADLVKEVYSYVDKMIGEDATRCVIRKGDFRFPATLVREAERGNGADAPTPPVQLVHLNQHNSHKTRRKSKALAGDQAVLSVRNQHTIILGRAVDQAEIQ